MGLVEDDPPGSLGLSIVSSIHTPTLALPELALLACLLACLRAMEQRWRYRSLRCLLACLVAMEQK
eukprot:149478-Heterocapsa_arctica.AAC.1